MYLPPWQNGKAFRHKFFTFCFSQRLWVQIPSQDNIFPNFFVILKGQYRTNFELGKSLLVLHKEHLL
jgi:hypothetical protein